MKRILCVFGTRPEAIKLAPLVIGLQNHSEFTVKICVTAQHRSMLDQVLSLFNMEPDYDLNIMSHNQSLNTIATKILTGMPSVLADARPDCLLVQGDTSTTLLAALSAYYHKTAIAHVEAGLRTQNKYSPWPEEMNRKLTSSLADIHFAPTLEAKNNLLQENIAKEKIFITGNTVIDALLLAVEKLNASPILCAQLDQQFAFLDSTKKWILVTGHRRENLGEGFQQICEALRELALMRPDIEIVYPVHLNPNVQQPVQSLLADVKNIFLIEPQDYLPFVYLLNRCYVVLTDSGGIQEEAPALGKPVLVMRDTTERPEGIAAGTAKLVGTNSKTIVTETLELLDNTHIYKTMSRAHNPYGDGTAVQKTIRALEQLL